MKNVKKGKGEIASRVIDYAAQLGFSASMSKSGHLRFTRPDTRTVFFSCTPGDHRAYQNALSKLRRACAGVGDQSFG